MRKVFIEDFYNEKLQVNWDEMIGKFIKFLYDDIEGTIEVLELIKGKHNKLKVKYNERYQEIYTNHFKNCNICKIIGKITSEFKIEIGTRFKNDKRDIVITDRKIIDNHRYYQYYCNMCGYNSGKHYKGKEYKNELWIVESKILKGQGCSCCCPTPRIVVEGINDIPTTAPWMVKYFQGGYDEAKMYTKSSMTGINAVCPDCGKLRKKTVTPNKLYQVHSIGCSCSDGRSYIEKYMFSILEQLKLQSKINDFDIEKNYNWCQFYNPYKTIDTYGIYDFVIEEKQVIIETDGRWHKKDNNMSGQTAEESNWIDNIKDRLAEENRYKMIRISDEGDFKKNIINSDLNKLFDLSKIDWLKCEEFASKSLVKEVCEFKRLNPSVTTSEISKIMRYSINTVIRWLKTGTKLGWCEYSPQEEILKNAKSLNKNGLKVEIFKDGVSLGTFPSVSELVRQSENLYNVKFVNYRISNVCRGIKQQYKGFTFKYI